MIENVFSKNIRLETKDPFSLYLVIFDIAREFGEPLEKKNIYETDGPRKRVEICFEINREIDKFTRARIFFDLNGESNSRGFLDVRVKGKFQTRMSRGGTISQTFNNYYISELLPYIKSESIRLKDIGNTLEKRINELK